LEVANKNSRPIRYEWEFDGKRVPGLRTAYIKMPPKPGSYVVTVSLLEKDESTMTDAGMSVVHAPSEPGAANASQARTTIEVIAEKVAEVPEKPTSSSWPASIVQICGGSADGNKDAGAKSQQSKGAKNRSAASNQKSTRAGCG